MTCTDCVHYEVCKNFSDLGLGTLNEDECGMFKDKERVLELPCKAGDKIFAIVDNAVIHKGIVEDKVSSIDIFQYKEGWYFRIRVENFPCYIVGSWNEEIFDTREKAEKKLEELKNAEEIH